VYRVLRDGHVACKFAGVLSPTPFSGPVERVQTRAILPAAIRF
jgi:hypothetical protein